MYQYNNYFQQIQAQNNKITELEKTIQLLQSEMRKLKDNSATKIEKIEYKFDQLKIERLEGTLNIGLNPTDPNQVENFDVAQNGVNIHGMQKELREQLGAQVSEELHQFLNGECLSLIGNIEEKFNYRLDEPHRRHIIEDIRKQIDSRIHYYVNGIHLTENDSLDDHKKAIVTNVKKDVENSITHFLNHLPTNMKGNE
ncbi:spore germination protein GerPC [Metabacillus fastidiosus]|uniref:Spore germination protein GerPC n=1 Tax=Metabacillus fastidiosus TaxID=1458 RepID=A0ABU6P288_9BACI|nr:spore germination protein GerPC [Metabacillus fastidiosus]MED4403138.1 spore germination protein GerPC [Metabacillus fastidiosus]MED4455372.1 spore germination protein GerPC [Metabacillus fastidiosus]MED4461563.1 spore germination protein GerPC [Metabacillus fastidiosus]